MSEKQQTQRLERIVYYSASEATEEVFTAAAQDLFGAVDVHRLDGESAAAAAVTDFDRALLVMAGEDSAEGIGTLRALRERGVTAPALLLLSSNGPDFEADLAELGPAAAFPSEGFSQEDFEVCVSALDAMAYSPPPPAAPVAAEDAAPPVAETFDDDRGDGAADEGALAQAATLESIDVEESTVWKTLDALRQRRRKQVDALAKAGRSSQRRLETLKKRLAKTQESLSVEKRQRWEVVLDLRESQERIKEVEERLQRARDGEARRQKEIDGLRLDLEQRSSSLVVLTRERDAAQQRFEQAQKGLEKKTDLSRARIEELREETERLREEHSRSTRELEDRIAGLELELEESNHDVAIRADELSGITLQRGLLEAELAKLRESSSVEREQGILRVAALEDEGRVLRQRLEHLVQSEGGRVAQLEAERKEAVAGLERRTEELSKALAARDALEKDLHQLRAQYHQEKEESQAWIGELDREVERLRGELTVLGQQNEGELEELRGRLEAAGVELEAARVEAAHAADALAEEQGAKSGFERQLAELAKAAAKEREEAQARITKLAEERDRLDARLRRSSAESGKVSDLQKELDTLLAELADKEEERAALRGARESLEREIEEARAALVTEKEEAASRVAALAAERSDLDRQLQEARDHGQTLERQMASLRAEVVELEVAREEDAERLRELGGKDAAASRQRGDEVREERDRLKRELDALRIDAENTRRALADSDARLRKMQQEKSAARAEPRDKKGDLAIQQLRAELGSLGD
jgi:chromosome segregation ATPase